MGPYFPSHVLLIPFKGLLTNPELKDETKGFTDLPIPTSYKGVVYCSSKDICTIRK